MKQPKQEEQDRNLAKQLYGLEPDMNLQFTVFAPEENIYLREHAQPEEN